MAQVFSFDQTAFSKNAEPDWIVATPSTPALAVIKQMHQTQTSCVLVLNADKLVGIFTERDVVRAIAQAVDLQRAIADLMVHPVITLNASDIRDFEQIQQQFQQHQIRHLPILGAQQQVLRVLTPEWLWEVMLAERIRVEALLRQQDQQYRQAVENSPNAIFSTDRHGIIQTWNRACEQIYDYDSSICGQSLKTLIPNNAVYAAIHTLLEQVFNGESFSDIEIAYHCRDGSKRYTLSRLYPLRDRQGEIESCVIASTDVTDRKRAEENVQQMNIALTHAMPGISCVDVNNRYIDVNENYAQMLGYTSAELIGQPWQSSVHPEDHERVLAAYQQMLQTGNAEIEARAIRKDGTWFYKQVFMVQSQTEILKPMGHYCFMKDITKRKQAELLLKQQAEREKLMSHIMQRVRQALDLDYVLSTTVAEVQQFLQADRVLIYRFAEDWSGDVLVEAIAHPKFSLQGRTIADPCFKSEWTQPYNEGRVSAVSNIYTASITDCHRDFLMQYQVIANLVVPILSGDRLWGLLLAHQCEMPREWQSWEIDLLRQLATQVGIAIQQSELYHQVQQLNSSLEIQVQKRTADLRKALKFEALLKRITDKVRDSLDEGQILQKAVQELAIGLAVHSCDTGLYDLEQALSVVRYEHTIAGFPKLLGELVWMADYQDIYNRLLQGEYVQFCWIPSSLPPAAALRDLQEAFTVLACPLIDDQGVLGDLWLYRAVHETFGDMEIRLVQQVANQCAIAIRQARLYAESQTQVRELGRLNRLKDDFLSSVSHELRTPMANIKMSAEMLEINLRQLGFLGQQPPLPIDRYFQILKDECKQELKLLNDLLDLSRLDAGTEPLLVSTLDLESWLHHIVEPFWERTQRQQQQLTIQVAADLPPLTTDFSYLGRIIGELLTNACKYTPAGEQIHVTATLSDPHSSAWIERDRPHFPSIPKVAIHITNTGTEIPESEQSLIFERFYRIPSHDPWKHEGTGLGLALIKRLAQQISGTIQVSSSHNQVTFSVLLTELKS